MKRYLPTRAQDFATLVIAVAWLGYVLLAAAWGLQSYRSSNRAAEERVTAASLVVATHAEWVTAFATQATRRIASIAIDDDVRERDIAAGVATAIEGLPASAKVYIVGAEGNTRFSTDPDV